MGLRDAFKSLRRDNDGEPEEMALQSEASDSTWFQPRVDGMYQGAPADGSDGPTRFLRFTSRGTVSEGVDLDVTTAWDTLLDSGDEISGGDYTGVGSFCVQRPFERPTVYTVLDIAEDGFSARCTATAAGTTKTYQFILVGAGA